MIVSRIQLKAFENDSGGLALVSAGAVHITLMNIEPAKTISFKAFCRYPF